MKQKLIVTFAVVVSVFAVLLIADVVLAGDIFLPLITKGEANTTVGPSGALFVFSSVGTTTGNAGGRSGMNAICEATDPSSHLCTLIEVENAFGTTGVKFSASFPKSWVDSPIDGVWGGFHNDCGGWTDSTQPSAYVIELNGYRKASGFCSSSLPVTCCKWIP